MLFDVETENSPQTITELKLCHANFYAQRCKATSLFFVFKGMLLLFSISNLLSSVFFLIFLPIRSLYVFLSLSFLFHFYVNCYVLSCSVSLKIYYSKTSNFFRFFNAFLISMRKINHKFILLTDIRKALQDVCVCVF